MAGGPRRGGRRRIKRARHMALLPYVKEEQ